MNNIIFGFVVVLIIIGIFITLYLTGKFCCKNEVIQDGKCVFCPIGSGFNIDTKSCEICPVGQISHDGVCGVCETGKVIKADGTCGSCESGQGITNGVCGVCKNNEEIKDDGSCGVCGSGYNFDSSSKKCILNTTVSSINSLIQSLTNDINHLTPITLTII